MNITNGIKVLEFICDDSASIAYSNVSQEVVVTLKEDVKLIGDFKDYHLVWIKKDQERISMLARDNRCREWMGVGFPTNSDWIKDITTILERIQITKETIKEYKLNQLWQREAKVLKELQSIRQEINSLEP